MKDSLGDRMKEYYENRSRIYLPRRTNTLIRIDGKSFHSYTKGLSKPFDDSLMEDMDKTAIALCESIQGCKLGYVQSDEITLWLTDYDDINTAAWFDGNIQKITSVSASIATAAFNHARVKRCLVEARAIGPVCLNDDIDSWDYFVSANFDSRVWTIAELHEVANCFLWRSQDASRNSVQMLARSLYSHSECEGKNNSELQDMIHAKGNNWNNLPSRYKCGRIIIKKKYDIEHQSIITATRKNWEVEDVSYSFDYWMGLIQKLKPSIIS